MLKESFRWKNDTRRNLNLQVNDEHWSGNGKDKYVEYFPYYSKDKNSIDCLDKKLDICNNNIGESQKN